MCMMCIGSRFQILCMEMSGLLRSFLQNLVEREIFFLCSDGILRDKINLEVEEFRQNLQSLLDEQQNRIHHLIQLSTEDTPQQVKFSPDFYF